MINFCSLVITHLIIELIITHRNIQSKKCINYKKKKIKEIMLPHCIDDYSNTISNF